MFKMQNFITHETGISLNNYIYHSISLFKYSASELNDYIRYKCEENPLIYIDEDNLPLSVVSYHKSPETSETISELFTHFNCSLNDEEKNTMNYILNSLDSNGFLKADTYELSLLAHTSESQVNRLITLLKSYEGQRGIGCWDSFDYLKFQLECQGLYKEVLFNIFITHLEDIKNRDFGFLSESSVDKEELGDYIALVMESCYLSPIVSNDIPYVEPDATIIKDKEEFKISINDYLSEGIEFEPITLNCGDEAFKKEIEKYRQDFEEMSSILNARRVYLTSILTVIVHTQKKYLQGFSSFLNPLDQNDLAEATSLSPATISRLLNNKFVATPHGTVPIQSLLSKEYKNNCSVSYVMYLIRSIKGFEKMSDSKISKNLYNFGVSISRRTVNKYKNQILEHI